MKLHKKNFPLQFLLAGRIGLYKGPDLDRAGRLLEPLACPIKAHIFKMLFYKVPQFSTAGLCPKMGAWRRERLIPLVYFKENKGCFPVMRIFYVRVLNTRQ